MNKTYCSNIRKEKEEQKIALDKLKSVAPNSGMPKKKQDHPIAGRLTSYVVHPGDTFNKLALKLCITVDALMRFNPEITDVNKLKVDQVIRYPESIVLCPKLLQDVPLKFD